MKVSFALSLLIVVTACRPRPEPQSNVPPPTQNVRPSSRCKAKHRQSRESSRCTRSRTP